MFVASLAPWLSRLCGLSTLSLLLLLASRAAVTGEPPPFAVFLYVGRLSLVLAFVVGLPWAALGALEARLPRGRLTASLMLAGASLALVHPIARHVASGDGLRARGISPVLSEAAVSAGAVCIALIIWTYRYWARRRALDLVLPCMVIAALLACAGLVSRAQVELAALLQLFALLFGVELAHVAFAHAPRLLMRVELVGASLGLALALCGAVLPERLASGRRLSALTESGLGFAAARLSFVRAPPRFPVGADDIDAQCARRLRVAPLPRVDLPEDERRNVVLISIDSVRADFVRRSMQGRPLMPELVGFMDESRHAPRAYSTFPATLMAMSSAFTGNAPSDLLLSPKPYDTVFTMTAKVLDRVEAIVPDGNYFRRPDVKEYLLSGAEVAYVSGAERQTDHAIERLRAMREAGERHLVWLHYYEPHASYVRHDAYDYGDTDVERYASELSYVDAELGRLLAVLREEGWYDDSLIIVFADHGEAFGEHNHQYHHYLVYPWLVSVPFAYHVPNVRPGPVLGPVQLMDVTPTVLQFLGLDLRRPSRGVPLLSGAPPADRPLFSEEVSASGRTLLAFRTQPVRNKEELLTRLSRIENGPGYASKLGVTRESYQLVEHRNSGAVELYDIDADPRAEDDLADAQPGVVQALSEEAERFRLDSVLRAYCELSR